MEFGPYSHCCFALNVWRRQCELEDIDLTFKYDQILASHLAFKGLRLNSFSLNSKKIGIIGGGQLAQMLALEAPQFGLSVRILCQKPDEPATTVTSDIVLGDPGHWPDLVKFAKNLDCITFESEFAPMQNFLRLEKQKKIPYIFPKPQLMSLWQDRASQKTLLQQAGIATLDWRLVNSEQDLSTAQKFFKKGFVLKKRRGGYDGYGTFFYDQKHSANLSLPLAHEQWIAEPWVRFRRELSLVVVRTRSQKIEMFDLFETRQTEGRCDYVVGPCQPQSSSYARILKNKVRILLNKLDYVGVIAFELFEESNGRLWVNEVAPRVHNSAHITQQAYARSQFYCHLAAGLDVELGPLQKTHKNFCMLNLIGTGRKLSQAPQKVQGTLHWYGKTENRKGRKLGHLNYVGPTSLSQLLRKALLERKKFKI